MHITYHRPIKKKCQGAKKEIFFCILFPDIKLKNTCNKTLKKYAENKKNLIIKITLNILKVFVHYFH